MKVTDYAKYIEGEAFMGTLNNKPLRGDKDLLQKGKDLLGVHETAKVNLELLDSHKVFYKTEVDFRESVSTKQREELFYALKNKMITPVAPASLVHLIKRCYETYGSVNFLTKLVSEKALTKILSKGFLEEGYSLRDVICSVTVDNYEPLSEHKLAVPNGNYWDIYITSEDAVAIIPTGIKECLTSDDIRKLEVKNGDIVLEGTPIKQLGGFIGVCNSTYDLREVI